MSEDEKSAEFEGLVRDFSHVTNEARLTYGELVQQEKSLMQDPAYLDGRHYEHRERMAQVAAIRRVKEVHEQGREQAKAARELRESDFTNDLHLKGLPPGVADSRKRNLLRLYGPKPGRDTPGYRQSLTPALRELLDREFGPPRDREPDLSGTRKKRPY